MLMRRDLQLDVKRGDTGLRQITVYFVDVFFQMQKTVGDCIEAIDNSVMPLARAWRDTYPRDTSCYPFAPGLKSCRQVDVELANKSFEVTSDTQVSAGKMLQNKHNTRDL